MTYTVSGGTLNPTHSLTVLTGCNMCFVCVWLAVGPSLCPMWPLNFETKRCRKDWCEYF